ncbi:MAG TPA: LacI family DNA-binding transcriptional regulator, partial [Kribbella sp.]
MAERRSATIKDVAAAAGVGIATVSRVFSGTGSASAATRERVLAAARELD